VYHQREHIMRPAVHSTPFPIATSQGLSITRLVASARTRQEASSPVCRERERMRPLLLLNTIDNTPLANQEASSTLSTIYHQRERERVTH